LRHAVTIDFHDTLFHCDEWFLLEVRDLPGRFLEWLSDQSTDAVNIVDTDKVARLYREIRVAAIEGGIEVDSHECVRRICSQIGVPLDQSTIERGVDVLMRETLPTSCPRPGVVAMVAELHSAGVKLGVISNAIHHPFLEWSLERAGLLDKFDLVLSSASAGFYKSRVELYLHAADLLDVAPDQIVHVGDSYRFDVEGAARAGMRTVWLNLNDEPVQAVKPDLEVQTLEGLAQKLLDLLQPEQNSLRDPHAR